MELGPSSPVAVANTQRRWTTVLTALVVALLLLAPMTTVQAHASEAEEPSPEIPSPTSAPAVTSDPEPEPELEPEPAPAPEAEPEPAPEPQPDPSPEPEPEPQPDPEPRPVPEPQPQADPFRPMKLGERSPRIRKLQSRLHQLGLHSEVITRRFDAETRRGVAAFKKRHGLPGRPGVVNRRTWSALVAVTKEPSRNALNNVYTPGKPLWKVGSKGRAVRRVEARLAQRKHFRGRVGPTFDKKTRNAVRAFQRAVRIPVTGQVDARTRSRLWAATRKPTRGELRNWQFNLDERCLKGRVICIDKTTRSLKWVVHGRVQMRLAARFGGPSTPTREGTFRVFWKSRDHVSSIFGTAMPFAMFFSGGQAVHYSDNFRRTGYSGASAGCVNIRNRTAIRRLFDRVRVGEKVVVHRS